MLALSASFDASSGLSCRQCSKLTAVKMQFILSSLRLFRIFSQICPAPSAYDSTDLVVRRCNKFCCDARSPTLPLPSALTSALGRSCCPDSRVHLTTQKKSRQINHVAQQLPTNVRAASFSVFLANDSGEMYRYAHILLKSMKPISMSSSVSESVAVRSCARDRDQVN